MRLLKCEIPKDCRDTKELCRALFAEFLGMTLFLFIGVGSVAATGEFLSQDGIDRVNTVSRLLPISMAFGMSIMVLVYCTGNLSGGHLNPAVSFFLCIIGDISPVRTILYMISQFSGATFGTLIIWGCTVGMKGVGNPPFGLGHNGLSNELHPSQGFLFELMGTFILCFAVLCTAVRGGGPSDGQPNLAPLVIGFSVFLSHIVLIPFTGCGINPARVFGPFLVNSFAGVNVWESWTWIYYVGPMAGAVLAAGCYSILCDFSEEDIDDELVHKYTMPIGQQTTGFSHRAIRREIVRRRSSSKLLEEEAARLQVEAMGINIQMPPIQEMTAQEKAAVELTPQDDHQKSV
jgi:aquaporin PIP